jgi:hypothetical protein
MPDLHHPRTLRDEPELASSFNVDAENHFSSHLELVISKLASIHAPPEFKVYHRVGNYSTPRRTPPPPPLGLFPVVRLLKDPMRDAQERLLRATTYRSLRDAHETLCWYMST